MGFLVAESSRWPLRLCALAWLKYNTSKYTMRFI